MKQSRILTGYAKLRDESLEALSFTVQAAMKNNPDFPDPSPSLQVLAETTAKFTDALAASRTRDKVKVLLKRDLRKELELVLTNLSHYCNGVARGNRTIQAGSGLPLSAETFSSKELATPENFTVLQGNNPGEVILSVASVANARAYSFLFTKTAVDNNEWEQKLNTSPFFTLSNLEIGQTYHFKIAVLGSNGQTANTGVITKTVYSF